MDENRSIESESHTVTGSIAYPVAKQSFVYLHFYR